MANEYVNKVVYGGTTLIDLTGDTVTADKILSGYTAHNQSGAPIEGTCTFDSDTTDANAQVAEILTGKTAYVAGRKITGDMPNRTGASGTISTKTGEYTIQSGYHDGSGKVSIDADEQAKLIPENILENVTILGVTGTLEPSSEIKIEPSRLVTPSTIQQTITPSGDYNALAQVVVEAIRYVEADNPQGGKTVTIAG